jgi:elongation factor 2
MEQIRKVMDNTDNIRNISVIAHVDHGKSTLTDSLVVRAGIVSADDLGDKRYTQIGEEEKKRGITIKSTGISLYYEHQTDKNSEKNPYLINLIDSPGHVDFSSEVTAALRVTDGALVVVDYVEGVCVQTSTVLRQALVELIKPVLVINKVDRALFELNHDPETIYQNFLRVIEMANIQISTYQKEDEVGDMQVNPLDGSVAFGSAYFGWGFTLFTFAKMMGDKFKMDPKKILPKLWGDNYFDKSANKWVKTNIGSDGSELQRGFVTHVLEPIIKLAKSIDKNNKEEYMSSIETLGIPLTSKDLEDKEPKQLMRKIMHSWIDMADALLEMVILQLPSPRTAQKYRTPYLYEGPIDDEVAQSMMRCDPEGPTMMFVSKMVFDGTRFLAFGRVFSGTLSAGNKVRILGPNYKVGKQEDYFEKNIMKVVVWMASKIESMDSVPCGNTCALVGIDQCLVKQGTITDHPNAHTIKSMKFSVSPVVRVAIRAKNPYDLPKLIEGLQKMQKADGIVQVLKTDTGEQIVAGCGELHIEMCLKDLVTQYTNNIEIITSEPVVPYRETVTEVSSQVCLSKSANKHNRISMTAEPLNEEFVQEIESGIVKVNDSFDAKYIERLLIDKFSWDSHDAKKLWVFGPELNYTNVLVDKTQSVQYLNEIRDSLENSFQCVTKEGVLAEETLRGIKFNIMDVTVHSDSSHRGGAQIVPTAKRAHYAAQLTAEPRFLEPVYLVEISAPNEVLSSIHKCFNQKRGNLFSEESVSGTPLLNLKGYLPVSESFGFTEYLRSLTGGKAFPQSTFDHWEIIRDDPLDKKSRAYKLLMEIRKRKGMKMELPIVSEYIDKI